MKKQTIVKKDSKAETKENKMYPDKDTDFPVNSQFSRSISIRANVDPKDLLVLKRTFEETTKISDELLSTLLMLRGKDYCLDNVVCKGEEVLENLYKKLSKNATVNRDKFISTAKAFYEYFHGCSYHKGFKSFFFSSKEIDSIQSEKFGYLREIGLFPIKIDAQISNDLQYSIVASNHAKIKGFEKIDKEYQANKEKWNKTIGESTLKHLNRYGEMLKGLSDLGTMGNFNGKKYDRFMGHWRNEQKIPDHISMLDFFRKIYQEKGKSHRFTAIDNFTYGYESEFMNHIYLNFSDLWLKEDVIGDEEYVSLIRGAYHWQKDVVGIASFSGYNKYEKLFMGDNKINYALDFSNKDQWLMKFNNVISKEPETITLRLCKNGYFNNLSVLEKNDENGRYKIRFSTEKQGKYFYEAFIREPFLRYNKDNDKIYVHFCLSEEIKENCPNHLDTRSDKYLFKSALLTNSRQKLGKLHYRDFHIVGVDLGINPVAKITVCKVHVDKNENLKITKIITEETRKNIDTNYLDQLNLLYKKIVSLKRLIRATVAFKKDGEEIPKMFKMGKKSPYFLNWTEVLNVNYDDYIKEISTFSVDRLSGLTLPMQWARSQNKWVVKDLTKMVRKGISDLIYARYFNCSDKTQYVTENNAVDITTFKKHDIISEIIGLQKMFSGGGKDVAKKDYLYLRGLRKHIGNYTASAIVSIAQKYNAVFIFIEDLDLKISGMNGKKENKVKILWGVGQLKKRLSEKAEKFGIGIVPVNPELTSQMDRETFLLGYRNPTNKKELYVKRDDKIEILDADETASYNVALRGLGHHANLIQFRADKMPNGCFRVMPDRKYKQGALYGYLNSTAVLFKDKGDGVLTIHKSKLTKKERDSRPIKGKKTFVVKNGKRWILRHVLDEEVKKYPEMYNSQN